MLIEEKYNEVCAYVYKIAMSWRAPAAGIKDIQHNVIERLLIENKKKEFVDPKALFGRTSNIAREETAKAFASRLPVSGVGFQAHWTAKKALHDADNDPHKAYEQQTGTSRVSRELMMHVAWGTGLNSDPHGLETLKDDPIERSDEHIEDNIRVALSTLSDRDREIVRMKLWNSMTYPAIAEELNLSRDHVQKLYHKALKALKSELEGAFPEYKD